MTRTGPTSWPAVIALTVSGVAFYIGLLFLMAMADSVIQGDLDPDTAIGAAVVAPLLLFPTLLLGRWAEARLRHLPPLSWSLVLVFLVLVAGFGYGWVLALIGAGSDPTGALILGGFVSPVFAAQRVLSNLDPRD